ncbi:hypothetical protein ABES03_10290 [Neobacillus rhizosphaerae]|uniref:hypothetical protein n=1 Tax=Neobacillus rhizosphaerae TaxID=2880965 RepID=UPI003D2C2B62
MKRMTQAEAIIEAFKALGGTRRIFEIKNWVDNKYGLNRWKDFNTTIADMVPISLGGNKTSTLPERVKVLKRVKVGHYCLIMTEGKMTE